MKQVLLSLVLFFSMTAVRADPALDRFEQVYGELLAFAWHQPVVIHGIRTVALDYTALWRDAADPDGRYRRVIRALAEVRPGRLSPPEAEAFWINAYNFAAMRLVVDHYPVPTIRSFRISWFQHPWSKKAIQVRDKWYSLSVIEKRMLLDRYRDPRLLFAVNCASVSCPDLPPEPYTAARLDRQLDDNLRRFLANPDKGLRLLRPGKVLQLSWIFKKDRSWFPPGDHGLISFITPYLEQETRNWLLGNPVTVEFLEHDWALNDLSQAER